jgi:hypothetical protein
MSSFPEVMLIYSDSYCAFRMGKTIQIIALFVSDDTKPNLVVA